MTIFAVIQSGSVLNIQVLSENDARDAAFTWVDVTNLDPKPAIGWAYDGNNFSNPNPGLPNCAYGQTVSFSTNAGIDSYSVGNAKVFTFPAGTPHPAVYLSIAIQENLALFQASLQDWIVYKYSLDIRFNLNALYTLAVQNGLLNRAAYILQIFTWAQAIVAYSASYMASIKALTDPAVVAATQWDFTQISVPDPKISPTAAITIMN